jgi:hypothetical protein
LDPDPEKNRPDSQHYFYAFLADSIVSFAALEIFEKSVQVSGLIMRNPLEMYL